MRYNVYNDGHYNCSKSLQEYCDSKDAIGLLCSKELAYFIVYGYFNPMSDTPEFGDDYCGDFTTTLQGWSEFILFHVLKL